MTAVAEIVVRSSPEPWVAIGLSVVDDVAQIGGILLRFEPAAADQPVAIAAWVLDGAPTKPASIDGLPTRHIDGGTRPAAVDGTAHPLGVVSFDHLVVMTDSLDRTCGAIEAATGEPLKRVREVGQIRQGFHRFGELIVEVVETRSATADHAALWGFVFVVDDIHGAADRLGPELISLPKAAVQPGRFIASFRPEAGLGLPIALMSP